MIKNRFLYRSPVDNLATADAYLFNPAQQQELIASIGNRVNGCGQHRPGTGNPRREAFANRNGTIGEIRHSKYF